MRLESPQKKRAGHVGWPARRLSAGGEKPASSEARGAKRLQVGSSLRRPAAGRRYTRGAGQQLLLEGPSLGLAPVLVRERSAVIHEINRSGLTVLLVRERAPCSGDC